MKRYTSTQGDGHTASHLGAGLVAVGALAVGLVPANAQVIELSTLNSGGAGGYTIPGFEAQQGVGYSVSGAGDVNGDGVGDILLGARASDTVAGVNAGRAFVVFGKASTSSIDLGAIAGGLSYDGFVINGEAANDELGVSVCTAGDVNGDGLADVLASSRWAPLSLSSVSGSDVDGGASALGHSCHHTRAGSRRWWNSTSTRCWPTRRE